MNPVGNLNINSVQKLNRNIKTFLLWVRANLPVNLDQSLLQDGLDLLGRESILQTVPDQNKELQCVVRLEPTRIFTTSDFRDKTPSLQMNRNKKQDRHCLEEGFSVKKVIIVPLKKEKLCHLEKGKYLIKIVEMRT